MAASLNPSVVIKAFSGPLEFHIRVAFSEDAGAGFLDPGPLAALREWIRGVLDSPGASVPSTAEVPELASEAYGRAVYVMLTLRKVGVNAVSVTAAPSSLLYVTVDLDAGA